jgi:pyruvate dehydrogenase E1 component beta subunit
MGAAVGAAMMGTRPVVEMRFSDFALCAVDELVNQAAKARYMFGGQARVPLVVRQPIGMWRSSAAQHSQSLEGWYTHIPGLVVAVPATPQDNYSLMRAAIRAADPVVYMEHKNLWGLAGEVDETLELPFGKARVSRAGSDVTLVTWSAMVQEAEKAVARAAEDGVSVELIDLRTLWPWDQAAVEASVQKTGRLLIAHEAVVTGGFGAEIGATIAETCFSALKAPIRRLGAPRVPIGYAPTLEDQVKILAERDLLPAIRRLVKS